MLISLNWLKDYVDVQVDVATLAERLTLAGNEVNRIHEQDVDFEGVVVAEVKSLRPLPGSTKNQIASVSTGQSVAEVVTGAWNLAVGDRVPYAVPGSRLNDRRIETKSFLGVPSAGMLCSANDLTVAPSPSWMQARLRAAGVRPISNVVDITNYVMLEAGQPMHAFDYQRLKDGRIVVRRAREGEEIACLDGKTRRLTSHDMVVADTERAQGVAGIIGGAESAVQQETTEVFLEAATWEPRSIRRTARALGLRTEASSRFEKGLSPALSLAAVDRAAGLVAELGGGKPTRSTGC